MINLSLDPKIGRRDLSLDPKVGAVSHDAELKHLGVVTHGTQVSAPYPAKRECPKLSLCSMESKYNFLENDNQTAKSTVTRRGDIISIGAPC